MTRGVWAAACAAAAGLALWGCGSDPAQPAPPAPVLLPDSACVALVQVDYLTHQLEGGIVRAFASQPDSGSPFLYSERVPGDFGWALVRYAAAPDTVFFGESIWLGCGERHVPRELWPADRFHRVGGTLPAITDFEYFFPSTGSFPDEDAARTAADAAWASLEGVDWVQAFTGRSPRAAVLFYSRCEGVFVPDQADWIVLLYANKPMTSDRPERP
jgi:hypothetical protein